MNGDDVVLHLVDCEVSIRGGTRIDEDGVAHVFINSRLSSDAQQRVLKHELKHIHCDDFHNDLPIHTVEGC
jgi:hypothetical protein